MTVAAARSCSTTNSSALLRVIVLLANLSATVTFGAISVITPSITQALAIPLSEGVWVSDAFLVGVVCVTPLSALLVSRFDSRRLLIVCLIGLALSSLTAAVVSTLPLLVAAVFVHGLSASPIAPVTQHLIASRFNGDERRHGMAWWTAGTFAGGIVGGMLGAPLAVQAGFPTALLLCLPFVSTTIVLLVRQRHLFGNRPEVTGSRRQPADLRGAGLLITGTLTLGFILNCKHNVDWSDHPAMFVTLGLFLAAATGFAWHYRRVVNPIIDLAPLRGGRFGAAVLFILGLNLVSTGQFETDMLETIFDFDAGFLSLRAGLGGLAMLLGTAAAGFLVRRAPAMLNLVLAFVALLLGKAGYVTYGGNLGPFGGLWPAIVSSLGFGMLASLLASYAFDRIDRKLMAAAAACFVFAGQIGSTVGLSALDTVMRAANQVHAASESSTFMLIFWLELFGAAALGLLIPAFRSRRADAIGQV